MSPEAELRQAAAQMNHVAAVLVEAMHNRDVWVCRMRDDGASLRKIADAAGLSAPGVQKILERHLSP